MRIGINTSFLRKPGTGIGQVTVNFLKKLTEYYVSGITYQGNAKYMIQDTKYILYTEEPIDIRLPSNFVNKCFLPRWWKRDDVPRKWLWERQLAREAAKDGCDAFLSLYQSATIFNQQPTANSQQKVKELIRHVMVVHDIIPRFFPEYQKTFIRAWYWKTVERGIRKADHIVTISEHTKKDLVRELHIPEKNISIASPDVAPRFHEMATAETVAAVLKKYDLSSGYIYHGGGLEVRKNAERLLRAYKQLTESREQRAGNREQSAEIPNLVISGKIFDTANTLATDVRGLVKELHLEEKVKLLGFVPDEDLPALYQGALFFVYPSLYEGFGLPVLEALYQGVPVLTSNNSSLPEVGGAAAIYVNPIDTEALADQIERFLTDETLRATLASQSKAQAVKFRWEDFVEKILATFKP
jgi:glycosyltransferase involved in cell wall biosynthesis